MPYTLMKGLGWILLALLLGVVIGWLLRSVVAKRQVARARNHHVDTVEMERLRGRVANLEPIAVERDALRAELDAAVQVRAKGRPAMVPPPGFHERLPDEVSDVAGDVRSASGGADLATSAVPKVASVTGPSAPSAPDVAAAAVVLGRPVTLDDLKEVEGVGPTIEDLCHGIGIRTWFDLATTEVSLLRTMLHDAGPRFRTLDPATWPHQARLLADGRWAEFKLFVDALEDGRAVERVEPSAPG